MATFLRRLAVTAAAVLIVSAVPAGAQQASPLSPAPAMPSPAMPSPAMPSPGTSGEPSAAAAALGREIVIASGISRSFDIIVPQFLDQIGTTLTQTRPDLIRDLNEVMAKVKPDFDKQAQSLTDEAGKVFAQRLSEKQLKDVVDFYKSASGIAYVQAQPQVMADIVPRMQTFTQRIATDMMTRVRAEMKSRGHSL